MDIAAAASAAAAAVNTVTSTATGAKSPEGETETPTRIHQAKPISFTNGVLKRHHHHLAAPLVVVTYKECLKNHAASMGGHALDGCGEFMHSPTANSADPTSLKCAACGCHRNFHRREPEEPTLLPPATHVIEYQPHHRHHPPPPQIPHGGVRSPNSASPPPISSSYYPSAPHMLLALSAGLSAPPDGTGAMVSPNPSSRKRFRTKFSQTQKDRMYEFAERVGWRLQKKDDELVHEFCNSIGVDRGVLKVWMHNNKNTLGKRDANGNRIIPETNGDEDPNHNHHRHGHEDPSHNHNHHRRNDDDDDEDDGGDGGIAHRIAPTTNGSSSSS